MGEIYYEDGSSLKIEFAYLHGDFHLYKSNSDIYEEVFSGTYKLKDDILILYVNDGQEIQLKRQE